MKNMRIWILHVTAVLFFFGAVAPSAFAVCEIVEGDKKLPFDGKMDHLIVEKRSLTLLNREFPDLNIIERTFTGEIQTCSNCTEKYIHCLN